VQQQRNTARIGRNVQTKNNQCNVRPNFTSTVVQVFGDPMFYRHYNPSNGEIAGGRIFGLLFRNDVAGSPRVIPTS